jgi:hypothetical protein
MNRFFCSTCELKQRELERSADALVEQEDPADPAQPLSPPGEGHLLRDLPLSVRQPGRRELQFGRVGIDEQLDVAVAVSGQAGQGGGVAKPNGQACR